MSEATAALGLPGSFTYRGRAFQFAPLRTLKVLAGFEDWLLRRADANLRKLGSVYPPAEYKAARRRYEHDVAAGRYAWEGPASDEALETPEGQIRVCTLMVQAHHSDFTEADFRAMYLDRTPSGQVKPNGEPLPWNEYVVGALLGNPDPNSRAPDAGGANGG